MTIHDVPPTPKTLEGAQDYGLAPLGTVAAPDAPDDFGTVIKACDGRWYSEDGRCIDPRLRRTVEHDGADTVRLRDAYEVWGPNAIVQVVGLRAEGEFVFTVFEGGGAFAWGYGTALPYPDVVVELLTLLRPGTESAEYTESLESTDPVNHPTHYTRFPVEVIDLTEHLNFCRGNAVKYLCRAGLKDPSAELEDLRKAAWYVNREIARLAAGADKPTGS